MERYHPPVRYPIQFNEVGRVDVHMGPCFIEDPGNVFEPLAIPRRIAVPGGHRWAVEDCEGEWTSNRESKMYVKYRCVHCKTLHYEVGPARDGDPREWQPLTIRT